MGLSDMTSEPSEFTIDSPLENESELLTRMFDSLTEGTLPPDAWTKLEIAAKYEDRMMEAASAFDAIAHDRKRLTAAGRPIAAEFLFRAAHFARAGLGDDAAADAYLERALREDTSHEPAREAAIARLEASGGTAKKLADVLIDAFRKDTGEPNAELYRRLARTLGDNPTTQKQAIALLEDCQRKQPSEETARALGDLYLQAGRLPELARTLEQLLASMPDEDVARKNALREELLLLFTQQLQSPERALPFAEALLEQNATHEGARDLCTLLLTNKGVQSRAALALANASSGFAFEEVRYLELALETTRGPQRRDVLKRLGMLREDPISDLRGAFEAFEGALLLDPSDDEVRSKFREIALSLNNPLDAARTLIRVAPSVKDPAARARIAVDTGELLDVANDKKRAKTTLTSALTAQGALPETQLRAARALASIHQEEGDTKSLIEMLERLSELETDDERKDASLAQMAELAESAADDDKAIAAYVRLVPRPQHRRRALERLETLYEATERWAELAQIMAERAADEPDAGARRVLLFRNAELLGGRVQEPRAAETAWEALLEEFGASRDIFAEYIPILEALRAFEKLDTVLVQDIDLAPDSERAMLYGRLAAFRIRRVRNHDTGLEALAKALDLDPSEAQARQLAESMLADPAARVHVAAILAPIYRTEDAGPQLLKVLEILGTEAEETSARLAAFTEAAELALAAGSPKAIDHAARAAEIATGDALRIRTRLLERVLEDLNATPTRRADAWSLALGTREVDGPEAFAVTMRAAESLEAAGHSERAAETYRRAARFAPDDRDLLGRIDNLLLSLGKPEERLAVYEESLAGAQDPAQRHSLYLQIAHVNAHDLGRQGEALSAYEAALEIQPGDEDALFAAIALYRKLGRMEDLVGAVTTYAPAAKRAMRPTLELEATRALGDLGQLEDAAARARLVLADPEITVPDLDKLVQLAEAWNDSQLLVAVLWQKSERLGEEQERADVLLRIATVETVESERRRALERAITAADHAQDEARLRLALGTMADALDIARKSGEELAPGYGDDYVMRLVELASQSGDFAEVARRLDALIVRTPQGEVRRAWAVRLARVYADELHDKPRAYAVIAREVEGGEHDDEMLGYGIKLAIETGSEVAYAATLDEQLLLITHNTWSTAANSGAFTLGLAKARTFAHSDAFFREAAAAYEAILDQADLFAAEGLPDALTEYHHFIEAALGRGLPARPERRRVQRRRVTRAVDAERAGILSEWANEEAADDKVLALSLYEELLGESPDDVGALAAVARLAGETGNLDKAAHALEEQRQRAEGERRWRLELELADLHLERKNDPIKALSHVREVLLVTPSDPDAFRLLARIAEHDDARAAVAEVVDQVVDRAIELSDTQGAAELLRWALAHVFVDAGATDTSDAVSRSLEKLASALQSLGQELDELEVRVLLASKHQDAAAWDRAEELARTLHAPEEVARAYEGVDYKSLPAEDAERIGERAVAFFEEWYEDPTKLLPLLDRLFAVAATSTVAFERLRLYYDTNERWDDLFGLYDRAIARAAASEREHLLEEIAHVAKDFAKNEAKAAVYFEALLDLRPKSASTEGALERLYERLGENEKLVQLLSGRKSTLTGAAREDNDRRIARLRAYALGDSASALPVLEELAESRAGDATDPSSRTLDTELTELFEKVLAGATDRVTRQRSARRLSEHYRERGDLNGLARVVRDELSAETDRDKRIVLLADLAETELSAGRAAEALSARAEILQLDADSDDALAALTTLARSENLVANAVDVIATLAEGQPRQRKSALRLSAAREALREPSLHPHAVDLYRAVFDDKKTPKPSRIESAVELETLYEQSGDASARLDVLERHAALEEDETKRADVLWRAGEQARAIGERPRAVAAFEARLKLVPSDVGTLDRLVESYDAAGAHADLARVLELRAAVPTVRADARTADLTRAAHLRDENLGDQKKAIALYELIVSHDGDTMGVSFALATLHGKLGDWASRREALLRAAELAPAGAATAQVLGELGELERTRLGNVPGALTSFAHALQQDPRAQTALHGLGALLEDADAKAEASALLLAAYRATDDTDGILSLVEVRKDTTEDPEAVVRILIEAAGLEETRRADAAAAFGYIERAFALAPARADLRDELQRLANVAGLYPRLREVYERVLADHDDLPAEAHLELARLLESPLGDIGAALARFRAVLDKDDTIREAALAVLRLGVPLEQYKLVAKVLGVFAEREGKLASDVLSATQTYLVGDRCVENPAEAAGRLAVAIESAAAKKRTSSPDSPAPKVLAAQAARWASEIGQDDLKAGALFRQALEQDAEDESLLGELVAVERRTGGELLVDSLLGLSRVRGGDLALLTEASEHALYTIRNAKLARSTLGLLRSLSIAFWTAKNGNPEAMDVARYARTKLEELYEREDLIEDRVTLLAQDAAEPWDAAEHRELLLRAAELSSDRLHDYGRAAAFYEQLFEKDGFDREVRDHLRRTLGLMGDADRLREFSIRELEVTTDSRERAEIRLRIAGLDPDRENAEAVLRTALEERPRDEALVAALGARLDEEKRYDELYALYTEQAERALTGENPDGTPIAFAEGTVRTRVDSMFPGRARARVKPEDARSANAFFLRAADVAEHRIADPRRALSSVEAAVRSFAEPRALAEAARLSTALERHGTAAHYLGRLLEVDPQVETFIELADVHDRDKNPAMTERVLEQALAVHPESTELRIRLARHYRKHGALKKLAPLLEDAIARAPNDDEKVAMSLESARLYTQVLGAPDRAIVLLEAARRLKPEDRPLRLAMADALGEGGRRDEGYALLEAELESYGSRRPKERAPLHLHLARLHRLGGDDTKALLELDTATKIDPTFQPAVRMLGELAEKSEQWEKAERAYRALLSVVRRVDSAPKSRPDSDDLSSAEVLLLLSRVATAKGEAVRGGEILETAFEAAQDAPLEAERLEARLRLFGDTQNLARILRMRTQHHDADADTYRELAQIELTTLGEPDRAFESARAAFRREPGRKIGDLLLEIAGTLGKEEDLEKEFEKNASELQAEGKLAHAARHASFLALLHMRRGHLDEAIRWIEKNRAASELTADDADLYAELRHAEGNFEGEVEALELLLEQAKDPALVLATKLRLARLLYGREASVEDGSRYLLEAREDGAPLATLTEIVGDAVADFASNAHLVELYVQLARELGEPAVIARALVRAWAISRDELSFLDEAVEAARSGGDLELEESVLRDVVETADPQNEPAALLFGLVQLAALRERQHDVSGVIGLLQRAAELADEDERTILLRRLAEYARAEGQLVIAAETNAALFQSNREDAQSLASLIELYRETKQGERLATLLAELAASAEDPSERLRLQFERLRVLEDDVGLSDAELVGPLRDIVLESPDETDAAERLVAILERSGPQSELSDLLDFLFEAALDRGMNEALAARAVKLAALYNETGENDRALTVFERATKALPHDADLLRAYAEELRKHGAKDRLESILDELATQDDPIAGANVSVEIADLALARGDVKASTAALERAVRLDPSNVHAASQLESTYRDSGNTPKLAAFLAESAPARPTARERAQAYQRAAELYATELRTPVRAAELYGLAEAEQPEDEELTFEAARAYVAAGDKERAATLLELRADGIGITNKARPRYLVELANVLASLDAVRAAKTMEEAARLEGRGTISDGYLDFVQGLLDNQGGSSRALTSAQRTELSFNLARALADRGELARAREVVDAELSENPDNIPGLLTLAELEERDGRLEDALSTYFRAFSLQSSDFALDLSLRVASLAEQLNRPDEARAALERIRLSLPEDRDVRQRLEAVYEAGGLFRSLAEICQELAALEDDDTRKFGYLLKAGNAFLESGEDLELAIEPLAEAHALRPNDLDAVALLSDANTSVGRIDAAAEILDSTLAAMKNRRSREIGTLYHRVARVAQARGDRQGEMAALTTALEMDPQNGTAALELSQIAIELGDLELAARALRALTMLRGEGPIPRALAYKQLGEIAWAQGDQKKAVIMLKRALDDDPRLEEARTLLSQIERR